MNTIPFYVLGIALGFVLGIIFMMVRGRSPTMTAEMPDESQPLPLETLEAAPEEAFQSHMETSPPGTSVETMTAENWLEELEFNMVSKPPQKKKDAEAPSESSEETEEIPSFDSTEVWLSGLRKIHDTVSKSNNSSHQTLPIVFDSTDRENP